MKQSETSARTRPVCRAGRVLLLLLLCAALPATAATAGDGSPLSPAAGLAEGSILRLKVFSDAAGRDWLSAEGYDIAGHALAEGWVEVITDTAGAQRLAGQGFTLELIEVRGGVRPPSQPGLGRATCSEPNNVHCYADPAEVEAFLQQTVLDHPDITRLVDLGTSHQGRTIWGLMISDNADQDEDELAILFNGAHHAREIMTPEVVMDAIDHLTDNYGIDPDLTAKVDAYEIWCVPIVNPDGVHRVHTVDDFWRKNTRDNDPPDGIINSYDGVDLNRNYEWGWGYQCEGSSSSPSSSTYRGPAEGSEPEPQAMLALGRKTRPVFDVEYHSYGEEVIYAMSCHPQFNPKLSTVTGPDQDISRVIAEGYAAAIVQADGQQGYSETPALYGVDGTGRDHQYHENGTIAFVTEVNSSAEGGFHPDFNLYRDDTVIGQRPGWLWLIDRISGPAVGGHVLDAVTGAPVEADVSLDELSLPDGKRLTSRPDTGRFHIIVVEGDYTLRASAPGYEDATMLLTVGPAWSSVTVNLQPLGAGLIVSENFEDPVTPTVWTAGVAGDTASSGIWEWGEPHGTHSGTAPAGTLEFGNPRLDRTPGENNNAFVTGNTASSSLSLDNVDGGTTTLMSPSYDLSGFYAVEVAWHRWFRNDVVDPGDMLEAEVSVNGGFSWFTLETLSFSTSTPDATPAWVPASVRLDDIVAPGSNVRLRFRANDDGTNNTVEAAIDDLTIHGYDLATQGEIREVRLSGGPSTVLDWQTVTGAPDAVYDVVRADLGNLSGGAGGVDLGALVCIEEDSVDTSTTGDPDTGTPAPGSGFFYLVRFGLGFSNGDWGYGSEDGLRTGTAGCTP